LEVKLEIIRNVLLDVEFINCEAVGDVYSCLRQLFCRIRLLLLVIDVCNGIVGVFDDLYSNMLTNR